MQFSDFRNAVSKQFQAMSKHQLYRVQVEKDTLWQTYINSFPEGTNPIFKERTEHDCQSCKSFIRAVGGVVAIIDGKLVSIWDVNLAGGMVDFDTRTITITSNSDPYQVVADALSQLVKSSVIDNQFLHTEPIAGVKQSRQLLETLDVKTWEHFFVNLPTECVVRGDMIGPKLSESRSTKDVFLRSLKEITLDSIDTVLELISQNSLYRGEEQRFAVQSFQKLKKQFSKIQNLSVEQDLFAWSQVKGIPQSVSRIRNTAIGTLLVDLSEGVDLDVAVASFDTKMAPTNYKRPTALVTKAMIQSAQAKIEELGFTSALERRYATIQDITINNILFADRSAKKAMNVFDEMAAKVPEKVKNLDKVEEVPIEKFLSDILPKAESLEVMFENRHSANLVSLIAPVDPTAKNMFKWPNNFSWSYTGELADSIKERVKKAGGKVDGEFRASLSWFNYDDLDLHLTEPSGVTIYYGSRLNPRTGGQLDVDMNAGGGGPGRGTRSAVENIFYSARRTMQEGLYKLKVNNYRKVETVDGGFDVELEFDGTIYSFGYAKAVADRDTITVAEFEYTHKNGLKITKSLPSTQTSKEVWGIPTQTFHKVNVAMLSPNHWDDRAVGNKHYFFMLEGCLNDGKARGFFNEFLTADLDQHRKVFEVVGSKMKTDESVNQLSGIGFSSTQRNHVLSRVKGSFARTIKITF